MAKRLHDFMTAGESGGVKIVHFDVERNFMAFREGVPPGRYTKLIVNGQIVMSDTPMEEQSNWGIMRLAAGDVLIAGLGLGMVLQPLLARDSVRSVTVIELNPDVIKLVAPHYKSEKLEVIHADIWTWRPAKGAKYDTIYFDIWPDRCAGNLPAMGKLHQSFKRYKRDRTSYMESWSRRELKSAARSNRRSLWWG